MFRSSSLLFAAILFSAAVYGQTRLEPEGGISGIQDSLLRNNDTIRSLFFEKGIVIAAFNLKLNKKKQAVHVTLRAESGLNTDAELVLRRQVYAMQWAVNDRKYRKKNYYMVFWFRPAPVMVSDSHIMAPVVPVDSIRLVKYEKSADDGEVRSARPAGSIAEISDCISGGQKGGSEQINKDCTFRATFRVLPDGSTAGFHIVENNSCGSTLPVSALNCIKNSEPWIPAVRAGKTVLSQQEVRMKDKELSFRAR